MSEEKEYKFSYKTGSLRVHRVIKAYSMEEAHEKGKNIALKETPEAHSFLTEHSIYEA